MKFEPKMSGTKVTDFEITPFFANCIISLADVLARDLKQETMDFILDNFRFYRGDRTEENKGECIWYAIIDYDTDLKIAVMENYPEYEKEFIDYFGEKWMNHYIRFGH